MIPEELVAAAQKAHAAICEESLEDCMDPDWRGKCVKAVEAAAPLIRAQALEDAADELDGEFTQIRRAQDKPFTWLCGIADAEQHLRARAVTERGGE